MEQESFVQRINRALQFFVRYSISSILLIYAAPKLLGVQFIAKAQNPFLE